MLTGAIGPPADRALVAAPDILAMRRSSLYFEVVRRIGLLALSQVETGPLLIRRALSMARPLDAP